MKLNKISKQAFIFCFLIISMFCSSVYGIDEYGNQLTTFTAYQDIGGSYITIVSETNSSYIENQNDTLLNSYSDIYFNVNSLLNKTEWNYGEISSTIAFGVQVFGNTSYQHPLSLVFPAYYEGNFWVVSAVSDMIDIDYNEVNICNITVWVDYNNGTGWINIEEYVFNLTYDFYSDPTPIETDEINMDIIYFWLFVITLFSTTISSMLVFKLGEMSYVTYALLSFGFCITFLITLIN